MNTWHEHKWGRPTLPPRAALGELGMEIVSAHVFAAIHFPCCALMQAAVEAVEATEAMEGSLWTSRLFCIAGL